VKTRELTSAYEKTGELPPEAPFFARDGIALFADDQEPRCARRAGSLAEYLAAHLRRLQAATTARCWPMWKRNKAAS